MKTLTLNADESNIVYNALRKALELVDDIVADAEQFPDNATEDTVATAVEEAAMLHTLLDKLVPTKDFTVLDEAG